MQGEGEEEALTWVCVVQDMLALGLTLKTAQYRDRYMACKECLVP